MVPEKISRHDYRPEETFSYQVSTDMRADLGVWRDFLLYFNGKEIMQELLLNYRQTTHITTDSSKFGFGGTYGMRYFMGKFPARWRAYDIQALETYPIFAIIGMIGEQLQHHSLVIRCDNAAVVHAINKQSCRQKRVMNMRPMVSILLSHRIVWKAVHVPGTSNDICDLLSRGQVPEQQWLREGLQMKRMAIPPPLLLENLSI